MDKNIKIIVAIPARGGSKGIPGKNIRMMCGKPLLAYSIENALSLKNAFRGSVVDVVVDTDDEEIAEIAKHYGAEVIMRPAELAGDDVTLDPVIFHAVTVKEAEVNDKYDIVMTMQPTSPTLRAITLQQAVEEFVESDKDTVISGVNAPHLSWTTDAAGNKIPAYEKRLNRQYLPAHYMETGAFVISRRECVSESGRIGKTVDIFELSEEESVDIDTASDWQLCEAILGRKKIILRADGEETLGMGHIYRCLSLAYHLTGHKVLFVTKKSAKLGADRIEASHFKYRLIDNDEEFFKIIDEEKPDIVVNDILNTEASYIEKLKLKVPRVVNFEDKGTGADLADAVINALYLDKNRHNRFNGFKYYFLRDEFLTANPKEFSDEVKNVLVMFGGSDPSNLTRKAYTALQNISEEFPGMEFHIITGYGYKYKNEICDDEVHNIFIHNDVKRVTTFMQEADLAITSQGRTIYELAAMGVPSVVLAQNTREMEHAFASVQNGYINLGLGSEQNEETIQSTVEWLIRTPNVRREMHETLRKNDFTKGQKRVISLILGDEEQ